MDETEVQQRARSFIAPLDLRDIGKDLSVYLRAANARLVEEELAPGESGSTLTRPDGKHVITVNSTESLERQRFTICHEIAHIILKLPSRHEEVAPWAFAKRDPNEIACDTFAAELLMPYALWLAKVTNDEPTAKTIQDLADAFGASFPAAASRYATLARFPCALVTMERGFIRYGARSTSLRRIGAWIAPRTAIPEGSVAHRLREAGATSIESDEVNQDLWFQDWRPGLAMYELSRHYSGFDTTISLLWFDEEDLPEREQDRFGRTIEDDGGLQELTGTLEWKKKTRRR